MYNFINDLEISKNNYENEIISPTENHESRKNSSIKQKRKYRSKKINGEKINFRVITDDDGVEIEIPAKKSPLKSFIASKKKRIEGTGIFASLNPSDREKIKSITTNEENRKIINSRPESVKLIQPKLLLCKQCFYTLKTYREIEDENFTLKRMLSERLDDNIILQNENTSLMFIEQQLEFKEQELYNLKEMFIELIEFNEMLMTRITEIDTEKTVI